MNVYDGKTQLNPACQVNRKPAENAEQGEKGHL